MTTGKQAIADTAQGDATVDRAAGFDCLLKQFAQHRTTDPLDDAEAAALHAALLESLMHAVGEALPLLDAERRRPHLYLIAALHTLIGGAREPVLTPVSRPAPAGGRVGRPAASVLQRVQVVHTVIAARLLIDKGGWPAGEADELAASLLNKLLPTGRGGRAIRSSTIAGWRRNRSKLIDGQCQVFIEDSLAKFDCMPPDKAREVATEWLKEALSKLPGSV